MKNTTTPATILVYDAGGRHENRFTVLFLEHESGTNTYLGFQLPSNPSLQDNPDFLAPKFIRPTKRLGKLIDYDELPGKVKKVIKKYV